MLRHGFCMRNVAMKIGVISQNMMAHLYDFLTHLNCKFVFVADTFVYKINVFLYLGSHRELLVLLKTNS
jgi:hypothetical protein